MNNPKFQIFMGKNGKHYFRLYARNGQQVLASEAYDTKSGCQNGIESVKTNAPNRNMYAMKEGSNGQYYFVLMAANNHVIGRSEMYSTAAACDNGVDAVARAAAESNGVEDTTA